MIAGLTQGACSAFGMWGPALANPNKVLQLRALDWDMNGYINKKIALNCEQVLLETSLELLCIIQMLEKEIHSLILEYWDLLEDLLVYLFEIHSFYRNFRCPTWNI